MRPNKRRILEALLFVLGDGDKRKACLTQHTTVKTFFLADKARYGCPITFDNYSAMEHGPVPSLVYDALKDGFNFLHHFGEARAPWERMPAPELGKGAIIFFAPHREPDLEALSESDLEELSNALTIVLSLTFGQLRKLTHEDAAYVDAWEDDEERRAFDMSYGLLFEVPDYERAAQLAFNSEHL